MGRAGRRALAPGWARPEVRALLTHLALHRDVAGGRLARDLWPGGPPAPAGRRSCGPWSPSSAGCSSPSCARAVAAERAGDPGAALKHALAAVDLWGDGPGELATARWAAAAVAERRERFATVARRWTATAASRPPPA